MANASQLTSDFKGDNLSVSMFGAVGDAQTVNTGAISVGSSLLTAAGAGFAPTDAGKLIIVVGAGVSGTALETTISAVTDATHVTLTAAASTGVSSAEVCWGTANAAKFQAAFNYAPPGTSANQATNFGIRLFVPAGRYLLEAGINARNKQFICFTGAGDATVIIPTSAIVGNVFDMSGSLRMGFSRCQVDGRYFKDQLAEIIAGDGTAENASYGEITVEYNLFLSIRTIVLGLGATTGRTVSAINYLHNRFYGCGSGVNLPNTIDTGSNGSKLYFRIQHNHFVQATAPSTATAGVAIFAGHGTNTDFDISHNIIDNSAIDGIQIFNRPFTTESTSLTSFQVSNNIIRNPGWAGIAVYGGNGVKVSDNTIINPGFAADSADFRRAAISVSTQITGASTNIGGANVTLVDNSLLDTQGSPTMRYGIIEVAPGGVGSADCSGVIAHNLLSGASVAPLNVYGKFSIQLHEPASKNWTFGKASPVAALNVLGNKQVQSPFVGSSFMLEDTVNTSVSAANFLLSRTFNMQFNGTNWITGNDAINNGFAVIAEDYGAQGGLRIYAGPTTASGTPQTLSPTQLQDYWQVKVWALGPVNRLLNLGSSFAYTTVAGTTKPIWVLAENVNGALLRLADGSGTGGIDGVGSHVFAQDGNGAGLVQILNGNIQISLGQPSTNVAGRITDLIADRATFLGAGFVYTQKAGIANGWWAIADDGSGGLLRLEDGTGTGGLDGLGSQILARASNAARLQIKKGNITTSIGEPSTAIAQQIDDGTSANRTLNLGPTFAYTVTHGTTAGWWALADDGSGGLLRLQDGSGSGGFDGIGSKILAKASTGLLQVGGFQMPTGATNGYVLTTDGSGNGTWQATSGGFPTGTWSSYSPSTTNLSSTTVTGFYNQIGKTTFFRVKVTGTSNGSNPALGLPFTPRDTNQTFATTITTSGATISGKGIVSGSTFVVGKYDNTALSNGVTYDFIVAGTLETT